MGDLVVDLGWVDPRRSAASVGGRREALVATERLRELSRLAIANPMSDFSDGQPPRTEHVGRPLHPDASEVISESRVADLGKRSLELATRRGDATGDVVEGELGRELLVDDGNGVVVQARAVTDGCGSLSGHISDTSSFVRRMSSGSTPSNAGA